MSTVITVGEIEREVSELERRLSSDGVYVGRADDEQSLARAREVLEVKRLDALSDELAEITAKNRGLAMQESQARDELATVEREIARLTARRGELASIVSNSLAQQMANHARRMDIERALHVPKV